MDSTESQRGRKSHKITKILKSFIKGKASVPKKDNFTLTIMRKFKKVLRSLVKNTYPKLHGLNFDIRVEHQYMKWESLIQLYRKHSEIIKSVSRTSNGPKTESHSTKRENEEKTYNKSFNRKLFSNDVIRDAFRLFLRLVFDSEYCKGLCNEFRFLCCKGEQNMHTEECEKKWMGLKNYYYYDFFDEIGAEERGEYNHGNEEDTDFLIVDFD